MPEEESNVLTLNLSVEKATQIIRGLANDSMRVQFSQHALKQMRARKIISTEVLRCLKLGNIVEGPARSIKANWELAMEVSSAGEIIKVAVALENDDRGKLHNNYNSV